MNRCDLLGHEMICIQHNMCIFLPIDQECQDLSLTVSVLNWVEDYKIYFHILNCVLDLAGPK